MDLRSLLTSRRDLVMGFATGYTIEAVAPFVESLLTDGAYVGEVVLFVGSDQREVIAYLRSRGVRPEVYRPDRYFVGSVVTKRWPAYRDYLRGQAARGRKPYRYVLIADVRDVIFQKPLFATPCPPLEFHQEAETARIGTCGYNSEWVRNNFGDSELAHLANERILCSGTVCGRSEEITPFLDLMTEILSGLPEDRRSAWGTDQAVLNYVAYHALLPGIVVCDNFRRVATLHHVEGASLRNDDHGRIINPDGGVSEIAHQWDRFPHLANPIMMESRIRRRATKRRLSRWLKYAQNHLKRASMKRSHGESLDATPA
jgi:hypothetical protein